jgi:hypothetical protein
MRLLAAILSILLVLGIPSAALAQETAEGVIEGQVINDTQGGGSVAGVEVTLVTYINDKMAGTRTTNTDDEGKFQFDNVVMEHTYLVLANYLGVGYYYPVEFEPGETTAFIEVGVCDTTASDEAIRVGLAHTIISIEEESLLVTKVFGLVNDGDRTYVGTDGVLFFTLPEGATDFEAPQELMPDYQFLDDNRLTYLVPFPPGERQLVFGYRMAKPESAEFTIPLVVDYPTDSLEVMVGGEEIEVAVTQLAPAEPVFTATNERFIHFHGENLPRGMVINLQLTDISGASRLPFVILWVIIAVIIAGTAFYLVKRGRRGHSHD